VSPVDKWRPATYFYRFSADVRPVSTGFAVAKKPAATYFYRFLPRPATYFYRNQGRLATYFYRFLVAGPSTYN
jgi:hypothetical protein